MRRKLPTGRITPVTGAPVRLLVDYDNAADFLEDYTENLYVSEGWTSYYGDLTLVRTGLIDAEAFLRLFERYIGTEMNKPGRKLHSVTWASRRKPWTSITCS